MRDARWCDRLVSYDSIPVIPFILLRIVDTSRTLARGVKSTESCAKIAGSTMSTLTAGALLVSHNNVFQFHINVLDHL